MSERVDMRAWYSVHMKRLARILFVFALFFLPSFAFAATLSPLPATRAITVGNTVTLSIVVGSPTQALNALSGTLTFPADLLHVISISKAGSIVSLWVQEPAFSNDAGTVQFEGVIPNPGFTGASGKVLTVTFLVMAPGNAEIGIKNGQVLANDGSGTNILTASPSTSITVSPHVEQPKPTPVVPEPSSILGEPVAITSSTHPDQKVTYAASHVVLDWTNHAGTTAVRIGYNRFKDTPGVVVYDPAISHKEIDLESGTWYFHVQEKGPSGWGPMATFAVHIDTSLTPPSAVPEPEPLAPVEVLAPVEPSPAPHAWSGVVLPVLLLLLMILCALVGYVFGKRSTPVKPKSGRHARSILHHEFSELKEAVAQEIAALQKSKSRESLTLQEERLINRIHKIIDRSERTIEDVIDETEE